MGAGFGEKNMVVMGVITVGILAVLALGAFGLKRSLFTGGYTLTAEFSDANGLRPGDLVQMAGVRVGKVGAITIVGDHVEVKLNVSGAKLSANTEARITPRTVVGKRAVRLETGDDFSQQLSDGDVIPLARTTVFQDAPDFNNAQEGLLSEVDEEGFNRFLETLTNITRGQREEVADLIDGGTRLTKIVNDQEEEVRTLLRELRGVSETLNSRDQELIKIIDDFEVVLSRLADRRAEIERFIEETNAASKEAADLVESERAQLDAILDEFHRDVELVNQRQLELAEGIAYLQAGVEGFASIAFAGEVPVPWGQQFVQSLGPVGVDLILGCGGIVDQRLDQILGPDPRSCDEQATGSRGDSGGGGGGDVPLPDDVALLRQDSRQGIDAPARQLLPADERSGAEGDSAQDGAGSGGGGGA
jgi:phospholipid/cholesterol/gamma-HCH transport system substrate-binding protein